MLEINALTKRFSVKESRKNHSEITPLDSLNLIVGDGEKIGIIGKSGEGKSTLASILCGFSAPDGGNVYYEGKPLFDKRRHYDRRTGIGIQLISQQPLQSLDPTQRAGSAVAETLRASKRVRNRQEAKKEVEKLFEKVRLEKDLLNRLPSQLSGGQAQRVVIARALAAHPQVLISDEATSMLDISSQAQIVELFNELVKDDGISVLFISHDESLVKAFADKSYKLSDGKLTIVEEGEK